MKNYSEIWITRHVVLMSVSAHLILAISMYIHGDIKLSLIIIVFTTIVTTLYMLPFRYAKSLNKYLIIIGPAIIPLIELKTGTNSGLFLGVSYTPIYILVVILLLIKPYDNKIIYRAFVFMSFIYTLYFDQILLLFSFKGLNIEFILNEYVYYKIPIVLTWLFILLTLGHYIDISTSTKKQSSKINETLTKQRNKIQEVNTFLELLILKKTQKVIIQDRKLTKYSNLIYHDIRSPLARIIGLNNLLTHHLQSNGNIELIEIINKMDKATLELDQIIKNIGTELSDNNEAIELNVHEYKKVM